jgi:hypothetical protein
MVNRTVKTADYGRQVDTAVPYRARKDKPYVYLGKKVGPVQIYKRRKMKIVR